MEKLPGTGKRNKWRGATTTWSTKSIRACVRSYELVDGSPKSTPGSHAAQHQERTLVEDAVKLY